MNKIVLKVAKKRSKIQIVKAKEALEKENELKKENIFQLFRKYKEVSSTEEELINMLNDIEARTDLELITNIDLPEELKHEEKKHKIFSIDEEEKLQVLFGKTNLHEDTIEEARAIDEEIKNLSQAKEKPVFTEIYTISEDDEPVDISLEKIYKKQFVDEELLVKKTQEAYQKGFEDCRDMAQINAKTKINEAYKWVRRIDNLIVELRKHYSKQINDVREKILSIAAIMAEVIIEKEIDKDENIILQQVKKIIDELDEDVVFKIHINPEYADFLERIKSKLMNNDRSFADTIIVKDDTLEKGDCIFYTSSGMIDAKISSQLEKIKQEIIKLDSEEKENNENISIDDAIPNVLEKPEFENEYEMLDEDDKGLDEYEMLDESDRELNELEKPDQYD
ncbi:MAG: hypothetical protein GX372_05480 [Ignavibacteria bacterium]|jgi:flagellar assembly protein FliH|nr:hypothetical protein [Ignavibacteria bacterium]